MLRHDFPILAAVAMVVREVTHILMALSTLVAPPVSQRVEHVKSKSDHDDLRHDVL